MRGVIYYHPVREKSIFEDGTIAYHDHIGSHNQDPYIWNDKFLHSYCHITQSTNEIGQINFWVSSDNLNKIDKLLCDLVFVIKEKIYWRDANKINQDDKMVDSEMAFKENYSYHTDHPYKKRKKYTLKADPEKSFQPQDENRELIDILPFLNLIGISTDWIQANIKSGWNSKPLKISEENTQKIYDYLIKVASIKLKGVDLKKLRLEFLEERKDKNVC